MSESNTDRKSKLLEASRLRRLGKLGDYIDTQSGIAGPSVRIVALRIRDQARCEIRQVLPGGALAASAVRGVPDQIADYELRMGRE
jgi:hypothetical protein